MARKSKRILGQTSGLFLLALLITVLPVGLALVSGKERSPEGREPLSASESMGAAAGTTVGRWTWQNPLPQGNALRSVFFVDAQTGWAVGDAGTILHTAEGGANWTLQPSGTANDLNGVAFVNAQIGWAVGARGTILKTTNGGVVWRPLSSGTTARLASVDFVDAQTGWAVGFFIILKTTDGGATWVRQDVGHLSANFFCVDFVDANTGWIVGQALTILKTTNGGATWTPQSSGITGGPYHLFSVSFVNATTGWAVGGFVLKTSDGGANWASQSTPSGQFPHAVAFVNESIGWVVGSPGLIAKTTDGGATWSAQSSGTLAYLLSIACVNTQLCWAVGGESTIVKTTDGGITWTAQSNGTREILRSVAFVDSRTGWAVGDYGTTTATILKTDNGGRTWLSQAADTRYNHLLAVASVDAQTGWAVGESGVILKTNNGGTTWVPQSSGTYANLAAVEFVSSQVGWTVGGGWPVGESGIILKTTDGGATWSPQTAGNINGLNSVAFVDAQTGWAVGGSGTILKTTNGGITWTRQNSGTTQSLYGVAFVDAQTGWAVGDSGTILKTSNGGERWIPQSFGTRVSFSSVAFVDSQTGWVVGGEGDGIGQWGVILKTTDGGVTWGRQASGSSNYLNSVSFADAQTGWAVGDRGTIIGYGPAENRAPSASIDSISPNPAVQGQSVSFAGYGSDPDVGDTIEAYNWRSGLDGQLSNEASFTKSDLSVGTHTIYLKVQDNNGGWSAEVSRSLAVSPKANAPPTAVIDSLSPNPAVQGQTVSFSGHGSDPDAGDTVQGYNWRSSLDGQLSASPSFTKSNLSVGTHTIYFKVQDSKGSWSEEVSRTLVVSPRANSPPTAIIQSITPSPATDTQAVSFSGRGTDPDGDSILGYTWRSSLDGQLSTSASFTRSDLSLGTHTIYFKVQDSRGAWSEEASQMLVVSSPTAPSASISGRVTDVNGNGISGVTLSAGLTGSGATNASGYYNVSGLTNGMYTLRPAKSGYVFWPVTRTVSVPPDSSGLDFTALGATEDADGDALLNAWEVYGYDADGDGTPDVRLPTMGANPLKKDIFVEVDYMVEYQSCPTGSCVAHSHRPKDEAIARIVQAFAEAPVPNQDGSTGITVHVDFGPDTIMDPITGAKWGELSHSDVLNHQDFLQPMNETWNWSGFDRTKSRQGHFDQRRARIFHYAIFAHDLGGKIDPGTSGISRNDGGSDAAFRKGASDFVVSLGGWTDSVGTVAEQAGTFMHELGHNLGLRHGGDDQQNFEPNYLSVMNYSFQAGGLLVDGAEGSLDYSRFGSIPPLDEAHLNELMGLDSGASVSRHGTRYYCNSQENRRVDFANLPIDWDCSGHLETDVRANINDGNPYAPDPRIGRLSGFDDWGALVYDGGAVGTDQGQSAATSPVDTASPIEELTFKVDGRIYRPYKIALSGGGDMVIAPGAVSRTSMTLTNLGALAATAAVQHISGTGWFDLSAIPVSVTLVPSSTLSVPITVSVPTLPSETIWSQVTISATIQEAPLMRDSITFRVRAGPLARWVAEPVTGKSPLGVSFADMSVGRINAWLWDFGDGVTSTLQSPTHTYTAAGMYTVTLTVSGPDGSDTRRKASFISVSDDYRTYLPVIGKGSTGW